MIVRTLILAVALVLLFVGLFHCLAPSRYQSIARVKIEAIESTSGSVTNYDPFQNEIELIKSEAVVAEVRRETNLRRDWGANSDRLRFLSQPFADLVVEPVRSTKFLEIKASTGNAEDSSKMANVIVEVCQRHHRLQEEKGEWGSRMHLISPATPPPRASFPNRYLGGALLALGGLLIVAWKFLEPQPQHP